MPDPRAVLSALTRTNFAASVHQFIYQYETGLYLPHNNLSRGHGLAASPRLHAIEACLRSSASSGAILEARQDSSLAAEALVQLIFGERTRFAATEPEAFIRIVQTLWVLEDEGVIGPSSLINDLSIQSLMYAPWTRGTINFAAKAISSMFISATYQNKDVLVQAVLHAVLYSPEDNEDNSLHELWNSGICSSLPESEMRSQVVLSAMMEIIKLPAIMHGDTLSKLVEVIKSATRSRFVHSGVLEGISGIFEEAEASKEVYIRVYVQLAELDTSDNISKHLFTISGLLRKADVPRMELQEVIYEAIDRLKRRLPKSIYREPFKRAFSSPWANEE